MLDRLKIRNSGLVAAAGGGCIREPGQGSGGGWVATFKDPDGNGLRLLQLA